MKDDILLFPGWMQDKGLYGNYFYLNIWEKKYIGYDLTRAKYLLGHSMGTLPALLSWKENPDTIIILFNPILPKRSSINILFRFANMILTSSGSIKAIKGSTKLKYLLVAIQNTITFQEIDALALIREIPKDKLIIIRGKDDKYFCDLESKTILQNSGIDFFELEDVGHFWCSKVDNFVEQFIK